MYKRTEEGHITTGCLTRVGKELFKRRHLKNVHEFGGEKSRKKIATFLEVWSQLLLWSLHISLSL